MQFVMPRLGWRCLLALSSLPSSLLLVFYRVTPESPRYLCMKGRMGEAHAVLKRIARMNRCELPPGTLISDNQVQLQRKSKAFPSDDTHLLLSPTIRRDDDESEHRMMLEEEDSRAVQAADAAGCSSSLHMLLSPDLLKSTLLLWIVFLGNAFSYYGLVLLTTELSNGRNKCSSSDNQAIPPEKSTHEEVNYRDVFIASFAGENFFSNTCSYYNKYNPSFSKSRLV